MSMLLDPKWQVTALAPLMRLFAGKGYATEQQANTALRALMLPGDVYQGNVSMYGADGRTNPEVINRSADLAGMMTLGAGAIPAEANSMRMGISRRPSNARVERIAAKSGYTSEDFELRPQGMAEYRGPAMLLRDKVYEGNPSDNHALIAEAHGFPDGMVPGFVTKDGVFHYQFAEDIPQGIKAYHGSPHDFDRFDMSKIGTGEGAQAYGHGLYFAENEGVAKQYRDNLSTYKLIQDYNNNNPANRPGQVAQWWTSGMDLPKIDEALSVLEPNSTQEMRDEWIRQGQKLFDEMNNKGRMYEVNIDADPNDFLDWDKPLSEQSGAALKYIKREWPDKIHESDWTGADIVDRAAMSAQNERLGRIRIGGQTFDAPDKVAASEHLRKQGIPGIRYLDQGSRAPARTAPTVPTTGSPSLEEIGYRPTSNYVVFDDKLISIVKKYGVAALVSAGVLSQVQGEELKAQGYY